MIVTSSVAHHKSVSVNLSTVYIWELGSF